MILTRNKYDTKNITFLNKLLATGELLEYIDSQWWYEGKRYATLEQLARYMMIPLSSTRYTLESYPRIHTMNTTC